MIKRKNSMLMEDISIPKYQDSYPILSKNRIIFLNETFTKEVSSTLSAWLLHYNCEDPEKDIIIYINSIGGDAAALSNIYDVMQMISAPINTVCLGKAYSAGAVLLAAGTAGKRYLFKHSEVMIHGIQCNFPTITDNTPIDASNYLKFLNNSNDSIMKILAKHTGHDLIKIKEDCKTDLFFSASEAIQYGLADFILKK